ncbi:MAG: hypothetical protein V1837_07530 [Candidatus Woesearchaeota archaeon]
MSNHVFIRDFQRGGSRSEHTPRGRASRPKTFKTEDAANKWAEQKGLKNFTLVNLKNEESSTKEIKVVS